jgi:hypothetical protein
MYPPEQLHRLPDGRTRLKAHDVRHLAVCKCGELADKRAAIERDGNHWHPSCLYREIGLDGMMALPSDQRRRVCISDMPADDMRKFIDVPL